MITVIHVRYVRLILAFGRKHPRCEAAEDDDEEADEY